MRLFVAIALPADLRSALQRLAGGLPGARWTSPENRHLTLRFIGEVERASANEIVEVLARVEAAPFDLEPAGVGTFGTRRQARHLWLGFRPAPALGQLQGRIEHALRRLGLAPERRKFHPHVTLARLRGVPAAKLGGYLQGQGAFTAAPFPVDRFGLYESHLGHDGAHYTLAAEFRFGPVAPAAPRAVAREG